MIKSFENRQHGLDLVRVIAVLFVSFAHFTYTAHHRVDISTIGNFEPIVNVSNWTLLMPDIFLSHYLGTYLGTLGVTLFFITTGYLMPLMLQRYNRREFLLNRIFRIFPTLIVCTLITWLFANWHNNQHFTITHFWHSIFLTFQFYNIPSIIPVLWTLVIEMIFYFLCFIIGQFNFFKVSCVLLTLFASCLGVHFFHVGILEFILKYLFIIFTGSLLYFLHTQNDINLWKKFFLGLYTIGFWYAIFTITESSSAYGRGSSIVISIGIVTLLLYFPLKQFPLITLIADIVYPIYLLHFTFGLSTMILIKKTLSQNPYIMLIFAYIIVLLLSYIMHLLIEKPFYFYIKQKLRRSDYESCSIFTSKRN